LNNFYKEEKSDIRLKRGNNNIKCNAENMREIKSIKENIDTNNKNFIYNIKNNIIIRPETVNNESKTLNLKLNYLTKNDIIGISEIFLCDKYFNNVICTNPDSKVLKVDMRIVKLLVDSDDIILNNKNIIVYHKYQILADILLNQRKIYFDSFFNQEKHNINVNMLNQDKSFNDTDNEKNDINNKDNSKELLGNNYTKSAFQRIRDKYNNLRTIRKIHEFKSSSFEQKLNQMNNNNKLIKKIIL
jgi:hypothetical protein